MEIYAKKQIFLGKNGKKVEKVKVVRHYGKNWPMVIKMLSALVHYVVNHRAKFGKDPMCGFGENPFENKNQDFQKVIVLV